MTTKNFLLVSLEENKAKQLAQIVSNDVCRKILDHLAVNDGHSTETEIASRLSIPISTVHYNLKQLVQSGIVKAEEFHYSKKGREVLHYTLANKYIIIAPKATESLSNKLRKILPVFAIVAGAGIAVQLFTGFSGRLGGQVMTANSALEKIAAGAVPQAAQAVQDSAVTGAVQTAQAQPSIALWFAIGALFALIVYLAYDIIRERAK